MRTTEETRQSFAIRMRNVEKRIGEFQLKIEDLTLEEGRIHGFIGGNGSGKTTAAKLMMGILSPDAGTIERKDLGPRDITMTSQRPYLLHDTVYANLVYPLRVRGRKPEESQVRALLARFGLEDKAKQYARSLSSGEQQKLSMLRALIFEPRFLIIDETLSNMDPESVEQFEEMILDIQKKNPVTWVIISHRLSHVYRLCDRLHFFSRGSVLASGTGDEILFKSSEPEIRRFMSKEMIRSGSAES